MTEDVEKRLRSWMHGSLAEVSVYNPMAIHVDELVQEEISNENVMETAVDLFLRLVGLLHVSRMPARPILVIPLRSESETLLMNPPETENELRQQITNESPSLFLTDWNASIHMKQIETYTRPLSIGLVPSERDGFLVTYHESRSVDDRDDRVFSRSIHVEYYPERFRKNA